MTTKTGVRKFRYSALKYGQRETKGAPEFLLFHAAAADVLQWADVDRLGPDNRRGAQRPLRELKVNKVKQYFVSEARNTIPTSVIVALDPGAVVFSGAADASGVGKHGTITINASGKKRPGLIIDGQHRVFGTHKFKPTLHLNVIAFVGGDDAERAFQFVVINNSASRVNKDHIKSLNLSYDKIKLNERLLKSSGLGLGIKDQKYDELQVVDASEPFKGLLKWPTNPKGFIPPNAIEGALAETHERANLLGIEELELEVFLAMWSVIRALRKAVWHDKSRLLHKVSIYAITVYVLESMISKQRNADDLIDFTAESILLEQVERVVGRIPEQFWTTEWTGKELDTGSGRQRLVEALQVIDSNMRFGRPWYERVSLINPALVANTSRARAHKKAKATTPPSKKPTSKQAQKATPKPVKKATAKQVKKPALKQTKKRSRS